MKSNIDRNKARTSHYISAWGVPKDIIECNQIAENKLAVMAFAPRNQRLTWRYATNGMSEISQKTEDGKIVRTELYIISKNPIPWCVPLLGALAEYPLQNETYFADFDTVPVGAPIDNENSRFSSLLISPFYPIDEDEQDMGEIDSITKEPIFIHLIVPLYESECEFAQIKGGKTLWKKILESKVSFELDAIRSAIV